MKKKKKHNFDLELTPLPRNTHLPFPQEPNTKKTYKIYKDGNHYVGTYAMERTNKGASNRQGLTDEQRFFDEQYVIALKQGTRPQSMFLTLKNVMLEQFPNLQDVDSFINENIKRKKHNFFSRLKRFKRKANLNLWNKFVTITYDDNLMDADTFRKKLRKCLSNLHSRKGWRYMGVFELGEDNGRLHFHALMYIPEDKMIGEIVERKDYSTKQHTMQITHSNTYFEKTFGRNDFEDLSQNEIRYGNTLEYLTKYLHKTNEKIIYSRGIASEIYKKIDDCDIATEMFDFGLKFVFFDDVIDVEKDVMHFKYQQASLFDDYYSQKMTG